MTLRARVIERHVLVVVALQTNQLDAEVFFLLLTSRVHIVLVAMRNVVLARLQLRPWRGALRVGISLLLTIACTSSGKRFENATSVVQ